MNEIIWIILTNLWMLTVHPSTHIRLTPPWIYAFIRNSLACSASESVPAKWKTICPVIALWATNSNVVLGSVSGTQGSIIGTFIFWQEKSSVEFFYLTPSIGAQFLLINHVSFTDHYEKKNRFFKLLHNVRKLKIHRRSLGLNLTFVPYLIHGTIFLSFIWTV